MSKLKNDKNRIKFIKDAEYDVWECKDYKTFYMTIRKQDQVIDEKNNRSKDKFLLFMSSTEIFDNIDSVDQAMQKGYARAEELYKKRLKSRPN